MGTDLPLEILVVDDETALLGALSEYLASAGYLVRPFSLGEAAEASFLERPADIVITDIKMPGISGMELLGRIRAVSVETPVILMTGFAEVDGAIEALRKGAFDFILKPYKLSDMRIVVEKAARHLALLRLADNYRRELEDTVAKRTLELTEALRQVRDTSCVVIERLTAAAELRDEDTGRHIARIGAYAGVIARRLGMPEDFVETIVAASAMHDVGKIGIPDSILLKAGELTPEEFEIVKTHTTLGERIVGGTDYPLLQMGASIALNHHENWDGSGYPNGLAGDAIPIAGRIVMLADRYDALRSRRPYKLSFGHAESCSILSKGYGITRPEHFDPRVLRAFEDTADRFAEIYEG
jgi:putative two-component system response regulator